MLGTADEDEIGYAAYTFLRSTNEATETTIHGRTSPAKKCGLVKSSFRPSDDACLLPFNIPGNAMLSVVLNRTALMLNEVSLGEDLAEECKLKSESIKKAIYKHGIVKTVHNEKMFAYEIDGYGSSYLMDDANIPSLLSLPFIGFIDQNDPIYQTTRKYLLSENNPYYYTGKAGHGVGGPHNGDGWVWPMAIIVEALTTDNDDEIMDCLRRLLSTTAGTNFMHESFWRDNAENYTRSWFAWANTLFGELIINLKKNKPQILTKFQF
jgi:meiotically up-regulated gene 157 (Mug157) protein